MPRFPFESVLQSMTEAQSSAKDIDIMQGLLQGIESGVNVSQVVGPIIEKQKRAKRLASIGQQLSQSEVLQQSGIPAEAFSEVFQQDPLNAINILGELGSRQQEQQAAIQESERIGELFSQPDTQRILSEQGIDPALAAETFAAGKQDVVFRALAPKKDKEPTAFQRQVQAEKILRGEMLKQFKQDPKGFVDLYGEEGLNIIKAKQIDPIESLLRQKLGTGIGR